MTRPPGVMGSRVEAAELGISGELTARGPGARPKLGEEWEGGRENQSPITHKSHTLIILYLFLLNWMAKSAIICMALLLKVISA